MQVDEQLPIGEVVGQTVGSVDRKGGLADPRHPVDRRDHDRALGAEGCEVSGQARNGLQLVESTGEVPYRRGQLMRDAATAAVRGSVSPAGKESRSSLGGAVSSPPPRAAAMSRSQPLSSSARAVASLVTVDSRGRRRPASNMLIACMETPQRCDRSS